MDRLITRSSDLYVVVCRPALPMDTQDVMELTKEYLGWQRLRAVCLAALAVRSR